MSYHNHTVKQRGVIKVTKTEQEKRDERMGKIVNNVSLLSDEDQIYVLGHVEGLAAKKAIDRKKNKKPKGA